jgi:hypothetical protein
MADLKFMIDIETTGIDPETNDLLQIGIVAVRFARDGYWHKGNSFQTFHHTDMVPQSEFAKEHMAELFEQCRKQPLAKPETIRGEIIDFCYKEIGRPAMIHFMGWNAGIFDLPFLVNKSILWPPGYETVNGKDKKIGDFHYHVYDLNGSLDLLKNVLMEDSSKKVQDYLDTLKGYPKYELPKDTKEHDAVFDCINQLNTLNAAISVFKQAGFKPPVL